MKFLLTDLRTQNTNLFLAIKEFIGRLEEDNDLISTRSIEYEYWNNAANELETLFQCHEQGIKAQIPAFRGNEEVLMDSNFTDLQITAIISRQLNESWSYDIMSADTADRAYLLYSKKWPNIFKLLMVWAWG